MTNTYIPKSKPPYEKSSNADLKKIMQMQKDIMVTSLKVELIACYLERSSEFLSPDYRRFLGLFVAWSCTGDIVTLRRVMVIDDLFNLCVEEFKNRCDAVVQDQGLSELERQENEIDAIDRLFADLVSSLYTAARHDKEPVKWPAKQIAYNTLGFMGEFYKQAV